MDVLDHVPGGDDVERSSGGDRVTQVTNRSDAIAEAIVGGLYPHRRGVASPDGPAALLGTCQEIPQPATDVEQPPRP